MHNDEWPPGPPDRVVTERRPRKVRSDKGTKRAVVERMRQEGFKLAAGYELLFTVDEVFDTILGPATLYSPTHRHWYYFTPSWEDAYVRPPHVDGLYLVCRERAGSILQEYIMLYYRPDTGRWYTQVGRNSWEIIPRMDALLREYRWAGIPEQLAQRLGLSRSG